MRAAALAILIVLFFSSRAQHSVAREWNEVLLEAIRGDFARPTVHARNLFHISAAMYDAWAICTSQATPYLVGGNVDGYRSSFAGFDMQATDSDVQTALSYAAFRLIEHRFSNSPGALQTLQAAKDLLENHYFLDAGFTSVDYSTGSFAALGNYIAAEYIDFGLQDGSNEQGDYGNTAYTPVNEPLVLDNPGNPTITDPNRWQPLAFDVFIDQSGNPIPSAVPEFLSPEWGQVSPFSLKKSEANMIMRDDFEYLVYYDPGPPPYIDADQGEGTSDEYKWGFSMVAIWSGQLDPAIDVRVDISPNGLGNISINSLPTSFQNFDQFYQYLEGGDTGTGYDVNPVTGLSYPAQMVKLGDYARVLAEFWADGPDSETPPGHWFTILNEVIDHPAFSKKFAGEGEPLSTLEWDIKAYFILGGAMHDVAIASWGLKGRYDYIRPISAIRYMADQGQSSDPTLPNYSPAGIPLVSGHIELVTADDPLVGAKSQHLNKVKVKAWKGPDYIIDPTTDVAGVDWILAENWWPYQRPTFVTPPFAGYVSGHSTYSRAAAEVLTALTGDPFFPGGIGEFVMPANNYLVFEQGPSETITLQWATYRDAADQCSLSRIWGGIHPPADDIPGRFIGEQIGKDAFQHALLFFNNQVPEIPLSMSTPDSKKFIVYPNPAVDFINVDIAPHDMGTKLELVLMDLYGRQVFTQSIGSETTHSIDVSQLRSGTYVLEFQGEALVKRRLINIK